ncbi:MAG: zinc ribbon domain-containing protein [Acidobacteriota bacterium]
MYCPSCGSQNQDELKFCTRCGTNLGIVSDALTGKFDAPAKIDERLVRLLKNYFRGRRNAAIGFALGVIGASKLGIAALLDTPVNLFMIIFNSVFASLFIFGIVWMLLGLAKWNNTSSELQALGFDNPQDALPKTRREPAALPEPSTVMVVKNLNTDLPKEAASVTEQTTRQLEEKVPIPQKISN